MACHVVLWIPTIVYRGFSVALETSIEKNISDIPKKQLFVRVSLLDNGSFEVALKSDQGTYNPIVTLCREDVSSNGLMSFTYKSTSNKESGFRFTTTEFPTAIYHIIKAFYHVHEFHDENNDSSLPPYVSSSKVDIRSTDNPALQHYLKTYSRVVSTFVEYLQLAIRRARITKDDVQPQVRTLIQNMCLTARGYEVYMGVLYRSKYNTKCHPDINTDRELRHVACNIENSLRYIRLIEHEYGEYKQQAFVQKVIDDAQQSIKSSKWSIGIGWGSVIIGIVSLIVAFVISQRSTRELNSVRDSMQEQLDSIPAFMIESENRALELYHKQEEIMDNQRSVDERLNKIDGRLYLLLHGQDENP